MSKLNVKAEKKRFVIAKRGDSFYTVKTMDIVYFFTENDITFVLTKEGKKFRCAQCLNVLEEQLDANFFRANRQYIINVEFVKSYSVYQKTKLIVEMDKAESYSKIIISRITAPKFRDWISSFSFFTP